MDKKYIRAEDLHVAANLVYGNTTDTFAYTDAACTVKCTTKELEDAFVKGMLLVIGTTQYRPVSLAVEEGVATVSYIKPNTDTATSADIGTVTSVADA